MKQKLLLIFMLLFTVNSVQLSAQWMPTSGPYPQDVKKVVQRGLYLYALTDSFSETRITYSSNGGFSWKNLYSSVGLSFNSIGAKGGVIMTCNDTDVYRSNNHGLTWLKCSSNLKTISQNATINSLQMFGNTAYVLTTNGVYKSVDNGSSWIMLNSSWSTNVLSLAVSDSTIYVGTKTNGIYRSLNGGQSWNNYYAGVLLDVNALTIFDGKVFAGTKTGLYYSLNDGVVWTLSNITNDISSFCIKNIDIFASCSDGGGVLKYTSDTTFAWQLVNTGLANTIVNSLAVSDTFLYAATADRVWKRPLNQLIFYNIFLTANPPNGGILNGSGSFPYGTEKDVIATPYPNWEFKEWTENGTVVLLDSMFSIVLYDDLNWTANFNLVNGIVNNNVENSVQVYPNPTQDQVILKTNATWKGKQFIVLDRMGKVVGEGIIENETTPISLQGFAPGHYFIHVANEFKQGFKILKK